MSASIHRILRVLLLSGLTGTGVRSVHAQIEYTIDGVPTAEEEEIRWLINRARFDGPAENALRSTSYNVPASSGPLAPHNALTLASRHHSEDLAKNNRPPDHNTVSGSAYYIPATTPGPPERFLAEGYINIGNWAENISVGTSISTAESAYLAWWNSSEHRGNMTNSLMLETGNGHYFWAASTFDNYYTLGLVWSNLAFFTDTMFFDANGDAKYSQGEGVGGVRVSFRVGGIAHATYDVSSAVGSFAILLSGITPPAAGAEVSLTNQNAGPVTLSIPRDYRAFDTVTLAPSETRVFGTFVRSAFSTNFGFRNVTRSAAPLTPPPLTVTKTGGTVQLSWPSQTGAQYVAQWVGDPAGNWQNIGTFLNGTGGVMTQTDTPTGTRKFYRVMLRRP